MSRRCAPKRTFAEQQLATSRWLVCEDAAIPVATDSAAELLRSLLAATCTHEHRVVELNLLVCRERLARWWDQHAWLNQAGRVEDDGVVGMLSLIDLEDWQQPPAAVAIRRVLDQEGVL